MADWGRYHGEVRDLGFRLLAFSTEPPRRAAELTERLILPFPVLSDEGCEVARELGIYDPETVTGIAGPVTWVAGTDRRVHFCSLDSISRRVQAKDVVAFLRTAGGGEPPRRRRVRPRLRDLLRAGLGALRRGARA